MGAGASTHPAAVDAEKRIAALEAQVTSLLAQTGAPGDTGTSAAAAAPAAGAAASGGDGDTPPEPVTTGFTFPDSMFSYTLDGTWDAGALAAYRAEAATLSGPAHAEWEALGLDGQRAKRDADMEAATSNPTNSSFLEKAPAKEVIIDTTAHAPCDNAELTVYVHAPPGDAAARRAAIVYCHGGGGVYNKAAHWASLCARYAVENDVVVFNVEYRLAPEHKAPAAVFDAAGTVLHVQANAEALGIDAGRICVAGDDGGALIAVGSTLELVKRNKDSAVKLVMAVFPQVSDLFARRLKPADKIRGVESARDEYFRVLDGHMKPKQARGFDAAYLWPTRMGDLLARRFPRTAIITSEFDYLRRPAEELGALLHRHGRLAEFVAHPGLGHCWHVNMEHPHSDKFWGDSKKLLEKHLLAKE